MLSEKKRTLRYLVVVSTLVFALTWTAAPAAASVTPPRAKLSPETAAPDLSSRVLDTLQRAHLWLTTGVLVPAKTLEHGARHGEGTGPAPEPDRPDVHTGIKGYDWDSAGDEREQ